MRVVELHALTTVALLFALLARGTEGGAVTYANHGEPALQAHFSDFYEIMTPEDYRIYQDRLHEIIDWGLRNTRQQDLRKGFLQGVAEDWRFVPTPLRQGLKRRHKDFGPLQERRRVTLDERNRQMRDRIDRGVAKKGYLVAYYMFNHDCNAMGPAEDREHSLFFQPLPRLRMAWPHSSRQVQHYLVALRQRKFNHMYVGVTQEFAPYGEREVEDWLRLKGYEGFKVKTQRVLLGKGPETYALAKDKIVNWSWGEEVKWVRFSEGEHGINVVSQIRTYGLLWTMNPLRKVLCHEKPWGKRGGAVAAVAVSTLRGHLLEGEERFCVWFEGGRQGDVWFDVLSFSKGAFPLGRLLMPVVRPLQNRFLVDVGRAMQKLVGESVPEKSVVANKSKWWWK